jgi:signal peptidase I
VSIIYTKDRKYYRRWVNIFPTLLLSGSTHYLSGRKHAALIWVLAQYAVISLVMILGIHPYIPFALTEQSPVIYVLYVVPLIALLDGLRKPIPVMGFKKGFLVLVCILSILLVPPFFTRTFLFQPLIMPTNAMSPTLQGHQRLENGSITRGDQLFVEKFTYLFKEPKRGDIIAYKTTKVDDTGEQKPMIYTDRVVGLPGERVSLLPPYVLIDGKVIEEPAIFKKMAAKEKGFTGYIFMQMGKFLQTEQDTYLLKDDEYFVLGDNSPNSADSRCYGPVQRSSIIGKAVYVYAPVSRKGIIE